MVLSCLFKALDLCNVTSSVSLIVLSILPITGVLGPGVEASRLLHISGDETGLDIVSHTVMSDTEEVARSEGIVRAAREPVRTHLANAYNGKTRGIRPVD